jgi:hypothetical protein
MKGYIQILVVLLLAIPFAYMAFDVIREIIKKSVTVYWRKAKAVLVSLLTPIKVM